MEIDGAERPAPSRACGFLFVRDDWAADHADELQHPAWLLVHAHLFYSVGRSTFGMYYLVHQKAPPIYNFHDSDYRRDDGRVSRGAISFRPGRKIRMLTADHLFTFTQQEIDRIDVRRPLFGVIAIFLLSAGYTLFLRVVGEETKKRGRLETEVAVARRIQQSLQPSAAFKTDWCEAAGITVPATEVGGDYFDMIKISDDEAVIAIADVSGHGVGAGILSAMTKSAFTPNFIIP